MSAKAGSLLAEQTSWHPLLSLSQPYSTDMHDCKSTTTDNPEAQGPATGLKMHQYRPVLAQLKSHCCITLGENGLCLLRMLTGGCRQGGAGRADRTNGKYLAASKSLLGAL